MFLARVGRRPRLFPAAVVLGLAVLCGCDAGPPTAQVRGKVLFKGGSVPKGGVRTVMLMPAVDSEMEIRKAASGEIQDDGSFEMFTRKPGDGVYLGKYDVTIAVWRGPMDPTPLIPDKYADPTTTPFHVTVDGDIDDLFFEIEPLGAALQGVK